MGLMISTSGPLSSSLPQAQGLAIQAEQPAKVAMPAGLPAVAEPHSRPNAWRYRPIDQSQVLTTLQVAPQHMDGSEAGGLLCRPGKSLMSLLPTHCAKRADGNLLNPVAVLLHSPCQEPYRLGIFVVTERLDAVHSRSDAPLLLHVGEPH